MTSNISIREFAGELIGFGSLIATIGALGLWAVALSTPHTNSVAHLSPVERDANASGSGFSSLPGSLATYSGEDK